jgi:hypothetical protein
MHHRRPEIILESNCYESVITIYADHRIASNGCFQENEDKRCNAAKAMPANGIPIGCLRESRATLDTAGGSRLYP